MQIVPLSCTLLNWIPRKKCKMFQSERRNVCQLYDNSWLTAEKYKKKLLNLSSVTKTDNISMMISYNQLDLDLVGGGDVSISLWLLCLGTQSTIALDEALNSVCSDLHTGMSTIFCIFEHIFTCFIYAQNIVECSCLLLNHAAQPDDHYYTDVHTSDDQCNQLDVWWPALSVLIDLWTSFLVQAWYKLWHVGSRIRHT